MKARLMAASALAVGALLSGCQSTVPGSPQTGAQKSAEPSFPTSRPSLTTPTKPPSSAPTPTPPAAAPPTGVVLPPQNGYVFIETKSSQTRCQINTAEVDCEAQFTNAPVVDGLPANGVRVTASGQLGWVSGNLGDIPVVTIDDRTYSAAGWTVVATEDGTRFTNDRTRHGMFVLAGEVEAF
jgi:hypothetical protein